MRQKLFSVSALLLWAVLYGTAPYRMAAVQEPQDERDIEAKEVLRDRRKSKTPTSSHSYRYRVRPPGQVMAGNLPSRRAAPKAGTETKEQYQFPVGSPPRDRTYITIGVTLWRVSLATEVERKEIEVAKERMTWDQQEREVVVTRISDESAITDQDLVQMSIEYLAHRDGAGVGPSNRAGYLYVINREQFSDGSLKKARLIFPTRLTYVGDNRVLPGKTVTLPDPSRPFRIKRSDSGQAQAYETYTIILSPVPLELPQDFGRMAMELSPDLVARWERQWGGGEVRADLQGGLGQAREQRELKANGDTGEARGTEDSAEDLTQDDRPPQTVFRGVVKPGGKMLVQVKLPFRATTVVSPPKP